MPRLQTERPLFLIMSTTLLFNAVGLDWLYRGLEKYTYITVRSILFKFIALLAMFALIHQKSDYVIYGGISIFAASASNIECPSVYPDQASRKVSVPETFKTCHDFFRNVMCYNDLYQSGYGYARLYQDRH